MFVIFIPIIVYSFLAKITFTKKKLAWIQAKLCEVITVSLQNIRDTTYLAKNIFLGLLIFGRTCLMFFIYFKALDIYISITALVVFCTLFKISVYIVITPGNLGIQEIAFGFLSEHMHIGMAEGVLVSALLRVIGVCSIVVLGIALGGMDLLQRRADFIQEPKGPL
jgi:hypothetical protein